MISSVTKKKLFLLACPLYLFFYMGDAILSSYYALNFINRGMDEHQQSVLLGLIPLSLFLGCIVLSEIAKTRKRALWLFRICAFLEAALVFGYHFCDTYVSLLILTPLLGFFNGAPFALIEGYLVPLTKKYGGSYSNIRLFGSIGYIVSLGMGYFVLSNLPLQNAYFFSCAFFFIALALSLLFPKEREDLFPERKEQKDAPKKKNAVFTYGAIIFILSNFFFYGAFNAATYILPVRLNGLGFLDQDYSLARAFGVTVELIALLLMPFLKKLSKNYLVPMLLGSSILALSIGFGVFVNDPWVLAYATFALSGIGKAFIFAYQSLLLEELVGDQSLGKVLTVATGGINLSTAILNNASSYLYNAISFQGYFGLMTGIGALGVVLLLFLFRQRKAVTPLETITYNESRE